MNLADIIALAKEGYKPQDIKELISLADGAGDGAGDDAGDDAGTGAGDDAGTGAGDDAGTGAGDDAGTGAGDDDGTGAGDDAGDDAGTGAGGESEMEQLVNQLKKQNKNLQDALKRMDLSGDKKTESASDILKETLSSLF